VILEFDPTPIDVHSEKEHAAGHYQGSFGFNPLLVSCEREVLAGILRPGNAAASNGAEDLPDARSAREIEDARATTESAQRPLKRRKRSRSTSTGVSAS
jgi:hypothetical protein